MAPTTKPKILIICGPTASGKTAFSIDVASKNNGEIICADATQIYKDIPILSSSPTEADKNQIPHHLYNFKPLGDTYSAGQFLEDTLALIKEISNRGKLPIIVGGTGLYIKALLDGMSQIPEIPSNIREKSRDLFNNLGNEKFYKELTKLDPKASSKLDPGNSQRLIRAYEVFLHTKKSIYDFHDLNSDSPLKDYDTKVIIIEANRAKLYKKCNDRFVQMLELGAIDEVTKIADRHDPDRIKAIGYKEIYQYIRSEISKEDLIKIATQKTRNYAKRQVTFFNHQIDGERMDMDEIDDHASSRAKHPEPGSCELYAHSIFSGLPRSASAPRNDGEKE